MKVFVVTFFMVISLQSLFGQKWNYGFGFEINRMNLATKAPDVKVPYSIWYTPNYGLSGIINIECQLNNVVTLSLNPSYGYYLNNWENFIFEESFLKVNHLSLSLGSRFKLWKFIIGQDIGFSRFIGIFTKVKDSFSNISYLTENRNIFYSSLYLGSYLYKQSHIYLKGTYYYDNLFISNGFDSDFNLVGPVYQRPIILSAGIKLNFGVSY